ncbi:E3 ubiquitin-protein ligase Midline-1-like [Lineus longissimus]|uniref:E3 ubiquitin-protein ligase Midline-1-like n=1 Tax=Lineus longissimus TaxID=88925 RepID=UPI00315DCC0E
MDPNRSDRDELREELICPVCLDYFQIPIIMPCSHVLCRGCAVRLFDRNFIKCPVCRDQSYVSGGVENLPRVITLENIIDRLQQGTPPAGAEGGEIEAVENPCDLETSILCQMCQGMPRRAKRSCQDCNASYCSQCLELSHPNRPPFTEHLLTEPRENPRPRVPKCSEHKEKANIYCMTCLSLGCLVCFELKTHEGHDLKSLDEAKVLLMELLSENIKKLDRSQELFSVAVGDGEKRLEEIKLSIERRRKQINDECNSLLSEIEDKRRYFMQDLEYEARIKSTTVEDFINEYQRHSVKALSLAQYAKELLQETDAAAFLQLAHSVNERVIIGTVKVSDISVESSADVECGSPKVKAVDFRKERTLLRDLNYLRAPSTPAIDVNKCSRSWNTVILVLSPMATDKMDDLVDTYHVYYSTEEEINRMTKKVEVFKTPQEERKVFNLLVGQNASAVIMPYLQTGTMYYFSIKAVNPAGESGSCEDVAVATLDTTDTEISVPVIDQMRSRTFTSSIQLYCAAPSQHQHEPTLEFHLLYREANVNIAPRIWKSKTMSSHGTNNHRIFGLEPNTQYEFMVLASGDDMACQLSEAVVLKTESSAY